MVFWNSLAFSMIPGPSVFPSGCEGKLGVALESLQGSLGPGSQNPKKPIKKIQVQDP